MSNIQSLNRLNNNPWTINLSTFSYIKDLGEGQFGEVKLVKDIKLGQLYALKKITKKLIKK